MSSRRAPLNTTYHIAQSNMSDDEYLTANSSSLVPNSAASWTPPVTLQPKSGIQLDPSALQAAGLSSTAVPTTQQSSPLGFTSDELKAIQRYQQSQANQTSNLNTQPNQQHLTTQAQQSYPPITQPSTIQQQPPPQRPNPSNQPKPQINSTASGGFTVQTQSTPVPQPFDPNYHNQMIHAFEQSALRGSAESNTVSVDTLLRPESPAHFTKLSNKKSDRIRDLEMTVRRHSDALTNLSTRVDTMTRRLDAGNNFPTDMVVSGIDKNFDHGEGSDSISHGRVVYAHISQSLRGTSNASLSRYYKALALLQENLDDLTNSE